MTELNAVYASDDNYSPYMGVSIYSLLVNNTSDFDKINVYVLDNGIGKKNRKLLQKQARYFKNVNITFHNISDKINQIKPKFETGWSPSIFGRYFIDDVVNVSVDKLLYIDCDTIVNKSLKTLLETDISDYYAAGVIDGYAYEQMDYLGMGDGMIYVNSGLLLINMKKWRDENVCKKLIEYVNSFDRKLIYPDQDAFNAVCGGSLLRIPLKYNFFQTMDPEYLDTYLEKDDPPYNREELEEVLSDNYANVVIFHFTGVKPWNKAESSKEFEKIFTGYAKKSCWKLKPKFRNASAALNHYRVSFVIGMYNLARKIVGDKFYNKVKQKVKGEDGENSDS